MNFPEDNKTVDVAIIGGGIAGAGIARDAALRGLSVVLFEKNTFGSGASSKSSKLIHGGIRYFELSWSALKQGDFNEAWKNFRFVFLSLRESKILHRIAPSLVKPIPLVIPIYKSNPRKPWVIYLGAILYSFLALLTGSVRFPRILSSANSVLKLLPTLKQEGLLGGILIWDHVTDDKLLVQKTIQSAVQNGAKAFENCPVTRYSYHEDKKTYEITVQKDNQHLTFFSQKLINATGPWVDKTRVLGHEENGNFILPILGSHLNFEKFSPYSVILQAKDGRVFFVISNDQGSRVGTTERFHADPDSASVSADEINYLLDSLSFYFPGLSLTKEKIISMDSGIRPLVNKGPAAQANKISREHEIRLGKIGAFHILGVKLTDHRRAAEEVIDRILPEFSAAKPYLKKKSLTSRIPL